jgi:hypothetical protein
MDVDNKEKPSLEQKGLAHEKFIERNLYHTTPAVTRGLSYSNLI